MTSRPCVCLGEDATAAKHAIRQSPRIARLADDTHFIASIARCAACGQRFLTLFCECVDWADSDDPQQWLAVPIFEAEAAQLAIAPVASDEDAVLRIIAGERRFLHHDMPKSAPGVLTWKTGSFYIPPHD